MAVNRLRITTFEKESAVLALRWFSEEQLVDDEVKSAEQFEDLSFEADISSFCDEEPDEKLIGLTQAGASIYQFLNNKSWLSNSLRSHRQSLLSIPMNNEYLRTIPWEILFNGTNFLTLESSRTFCVIRELDEPPQKAWTNQNRPLRILFMASAPEDVSPLEYEKEEAAILDVTLKQPVELIYEESGTIEGLQKIIEDYPDGYFDVFHLTGHAGNNQDHEPVFIMEDEFGDSKEVTVEELSNAFSGRFPRLIFLSGCSSAAVSEDLNQQSLVEALISNGAYTVVGWALPVYDEDSRLFTMELYRQLAIGKTLYESFNKALIFLHGKSSKSLSSDWYLARLFTNKEVSNVEDFVSPLKTPGREPIRYIEASNEFIDVSLGSKMEICSRKNFIGRRRDLQRCTKALKSVRGELSYHEGVLIYGMGGLGKSSLAARICDVLNHSHKKLFIWTGKVDQFELYKVLNDRIESQELIEQINRSGLSLKNKLRALFKEFLSVNPALFIFDDFEQNIVLNPSGVSVDDSALEILNIISSCIRESNSPSRLIITSRYSFKIAAPASLYELSLPSFQGIDLEKKLLQLSCLNDLKESGSSEVIQILNLADGNPRILERIEHVLSSDSFDLPTLVSRIQEITEVFSEELLLNVIIEQLDSQCKDLLAAISVYSIPFDKEDILAVINLTSLDSYIEQLISLGLVEKISSSNKVYYYVSDICKREITKAVDPQNISQALTDAGAHILSKLHTEGELEENEIVEAHRLLTLSGNKKDSVFLSTLYTFQSIKRYKLKDAERISLLTLNAFNQNSVEDLFDVYHGLARMYQVGGDVENAEKFFHELLNTNRAETDPEFNNNYGMFLADQGNFFEALKYFHKALTSYRDQGIEVKEAITLHNLMALYMHFNNQFIEDIKSLVQQIMSFKDDSKEMRSIKATTLTMWGALQVKLGGDTRAVPGILKNALSLAKEIGEWDTYVSVISEIVNYLSSLEGKQEECLKLLDHGIKVAEQNKIEVMKKRLQISKMLIEAELSGFNQQDFLKNINWLVQVKDWPTLLTLMNTYSYYLTDHQEKLVVVAQYTWLALRIAVSDVVKFNSLDALYSMISEESDMQDMKLFILGMMTALHQISDFTEVKNDMVKVMNDITLLYYQEFGVVPQDIASQLNQKGCKVADILRENFFMELERLIGQGNWLFDSSLLSDPGWIA